MPENDREAANGSANGGARVLLGLAWPIAALLGIIFIAAATVVVVALIQAPTEAIADLARLVAQGQTIQRMVALMIIAPALVVLALTGKAPGSAVVAALAAIAGYVLQPAGAH